MVIRSTIWRLSFVKLITMFMLSCSSGLAAAAEDTGLKTDFLFSTISYAPGQTFRNPAGVFFDGKRQEIYVADPGTNQIVILDPNGRPSFRFTHYVDSNIKPSGKTEGEPRSVAVTDNGEILIVDSLADYVDVLDYRGRQLARIYPADLLGLDRGKIRPSHVTVGPNDLIYIAVGGDDTAIIVINNRFELIRRIGKKGIGSGEFLGISGIWVDKEGKIYTTDSQRGASEDHKEAHCVQVFNSDGSLALSFGTHSVGPATFSLPHGIAVDGKGNIWTVDSARHKITVFDSTGKHIHNAGGFGRLPGNVNYPSAIATDGADRVFLVERVGRRLQGFRILEPARETIANKT